MPLQQTSTTSNPTTAHTPTPKLKRKRALSGDAPTKVLAPNRARKASPRHIASVRASFDSLSSDFRLLEHVDFEPFSPQIRHDGDSDGDDTVSMASSTDSKLAFMPNNRPIHRYTHALSELLSQLDAVENNGDKAARTARKEAVDVVESKLERIEDAVERVSVRSVHVEHSDIEGGLLAEDHLTAISQTLDAAAVNVGENMPSSELRSVTEAIATSPDSPRHFSSWAEAVSPTLDLAVNNSKLIDALLDSNEDHVSTLSEPSCDAAHLHATRTPSEVGSTAVIGAYHLDTMSRQSDTPEPPASDVGVTSASVDLINGQSAPVGASTPGEEESLATNSVADSLQAIGSILSGE
jgi:hypothetical protein